MIGPAACASVLLTPANAPTAVLFASDGRYAGGACRARHSRYQFNDTRNTDPAPIPNPLFVTPMRKTARATRPHQIDMVANNIVPHAFLHVSCLHVFMFQTPHATEESAARAAPSSCEWRNLLMKDSRLRH